MKKMVFRVLLFALLFISTFTAYADTDTALPVRVINVVYDDSGSMYYSEGKVNTWCQAKYSMEVFAAMLGENDTMNVYYMSDYEHDLSAKPRIVLFGSDGAETNVYKIHSQVTRAGNTPFNAVRKAYSDLNGTEADEKWLVILTDGEFEDGLMAQEEIDSFLNSKNPDVNVMFLGMGPKAAGITNAENKGIYYEEAQNNNQILNKITEICTRIFNSNKLEVNTSSKTVWFDLPMSELTVFAQGANVNIGGIKKTDGTLIKSSSAPVKVEYSNCDAINYDNSPDTGLLGSIATYKDDFDAGSYTVDVTGAETIEIYYKPNIDIAVYLNEINGKKNSDPHLLSAGEYTITFGFVKAGTDEPVPPSKLLGTVSYEVQIENNGNKHDKKYLDGDRVIIEEGSLDIAAKAEYLKYNSVSTNLHYSVYRDKAVTFHIRKEPVFYIVSEGIETKDYVEIEALVDGKTVSEEQWKEMTIPDLRVDDSQQDAVMDMPLLEKSKEPGVYRLSPVLPDGKPSTGTFRGFDYKIVYSQKFGDETWSGAAEGSVKFTDTRSWWERNWDEFVKLTILAGILFVAAGYLPFIKHYLPGGLNKRPYISCVSSEPGVKKKDGKGTVEKNLISTIIPYIPQTGRIKYVPKGVTGAPAMDVRAIRHRKMTVTNIGAFAGKDYITFDGESIKKGCKKFNTGAGVRIKVTRGEWTYICTPNQKK